ATDTAMDDVKNQVTDHGFPVGRVYEGLAPAKSTNRGPIGAVQGSNCHYPEPMTQACHERSRSKAKIPARRRQSARWEPRIRPPAGLARQRGETGCSGHPVWLAHGSGGTGQSAAKYP